MFEQKSLDKTDGDYFNIIIADSQDVTIQSRNTGHYWYLHCAGYPTEEALVIFHKHRFKDGYHQHGHARSLRQAIKSIVRHDDYQLNVRKCVWDYEQRIDAQINRLIDLRSEINAAIESMENPEERLLLKYRYLKNESWEDISYDLNVSYRTVHRIHASALNNFVVPE